MTNHETIPTSILTLAQKFAERYSDKFRFARGFGHFRFVKHDGHMEPVAFDRVWVLWLTDYREQVFQVAAEESRQSRAGDTGGEPTLLPCWVEEHKRLAVSDTWHSADTRAALRAICAAHWVGR